MSAWQPTASLAALSRRAALLAAIRGYFADAGVLEVETPLLASAPVTDPNIDAISSDRPDGAPGKYYLQTSPEYAMKRLLAAGSGPIYQICKAFRAGERGARHNPEFTMLEWYRPDRDFAGLIDEVAAVMALALGPLPLQVISYRQAFVESCGLDPHRASLADLQAAASRTGELGFSSEDRQLWLQLLMATVVEPALDPQRLTIICDFPAEQAALARLQPDEQGTLVARRFEAFYGGLELANGYDELRDAGELRRRFQADLAQRAAQCKAIPPVDQHLLAALDAGLPACCGVALGLDRLLMLALNARDIDQVISFPIERS